MNSKRKFSRFLVLTLITFEVVSLALVVGILYGNLSSSMLEEFLQEVRHERSEFSRALHDRFHSLEMRLSEMSSNNTLRVSLMLGVDSQLQETMRKLYPLSDGAFFLIHDKENSLFIPDMPESVKSLQPHLQRLVINDSPKEQEVKFARFDGDRFFSIFCNPIVRREEHLGTALVVYDISQDIYFWESLEAALPGRLCIQDGGSLVDLQTGLKESFSTEGLDTSKDSLSSSQRAAFVSLRDFPGLVYTTSSQLLEKRKESLIHTLLLLCSGIFLMTLLVAFIITRNVSTPLRSMVDQALKIARNPSSPPLRAEELKYDEFGKLGQAFNQVLKSLMDAQEKLKSQAKKDLDASEEKYQTLVETSPTGILSVNADGKILFANRKLEAITGFGQADLRSMKFRDLFHSDDMDSVHKAGMLNLRHDLDQAHEVRWVRKDDRSIWVELRSTQMEDLKEHVVLINVMDITDRKQAQAQIQEWKSRYEAAILASGHLLYDWNCQTNEVTYGGDIKRILGYSPEEIEGGLSFWNALIHPEDKSYFSEAIENLLASNDHADLEYRVRRKDGKYIIVEDTGYFVTDDQGNRTQMIGFVKDVSDRKKAEEHRQDLEAQLQRSEKMEALGTLAGGVAHDLNNILSGLVSYPDLLLMDIPEDSPLRKPILTIQNSGKKAAAIVQDLLTLARRGVALTEVTNLNDVIREYLKSPEYRKLKSFHPNVQVEADLEVDLLNVSASPVHLSKTVMNLVSNAAEALPEKGLVTVSTRNQYIDRLIRGYDEVKEGDYVILTVADDGIGLSSKDLERIFEPFYSKKVMGRSGTGLGMAVVWGTVKDHNGYIDVESKEGIGTTFRLYFPVTREEAEKEKSTTSIEAYMGNGETILVVDDVREQRQIASMLLTKLGYSVNAVSTGEKAVEYLKEESADLLILDMIMDPGIDGLDTYKQILELHPGQKAIIASGFSETDRVKEAQRLGAGQYVKKPYTLAKIGIAVKVELQS